MPIHQTEGEKGIGSSQKGKKYKKLTKQEEEGGKRKGEVGV